MKDKISTLQVFSLCWQIILSSAIGIITYITIFTVKQDGWISIIISCILGLIPIILYLYLMKFRPEMNFIELNEYLFGKIFGKILNSIIVILIASYIILYFYDLTNFITSQYLHKTPNIFVIFIFIIPIIYLLLQGLNVIGRTSFILFIFGLILLILTIMGLIGQVDINNFKPVLENSFGDIFNTSLTIIPYTSLPLIMLLCIPHKNIIDANKLNKRVIIAYLMSFIILLLALIFVISVLGPELALLYQFPEFHVLKRVSIGGFIERVESTLSLRWIFYMFTTVVFGLYFIMQYVKTTFQVRKKNILNFIVIIISIILLMASNWIFKSNTQSNAMILKVIPIFLSVISLGTIIIMFIRIKTKRY